MERQVNEGGGSALRCTHARQLGAYPVGIQLAARLFIGDAIACLGRLQRFAYLPVVLLQRAASLLELRCAPRCGERHDQLLALVFAPRRVGQPLLIRSGLQ